MTTASGQHHQRQASSNATTQSESGRSQLSLSSSLADVLRDVDGGRALFKKFCISEFSVENILWLESSASFRAKYTMLTSVATATAGEAVDIGASFEAFVDDLHSLIQGFIRSKGVLTLNLSASTSSSVLEFADGIDRATVNPAVMCETMRRGVQLLQKIDNAVMDLMRDTFSRFRRSPQYTKFVQRLSTVVELDLSQTIPTAPSRS